MGDERNRLNGRPGAAATTGAPDGLPGPGGIAPRLAATIRLLHPLPSALDAAVAAGVASLAGASAGRVAIVAGAMLSLQLAIGAANDWADAPDDARARPGKPIPSGHVSRTTAARLALGCAALGLALAAAAGPEAAAVGAIGLAIGLAYDLRLKRSPWSWVPYALGIPLLPVFGWVGAGAAMPPAAVALVAFAAVAGAGLAVTNALADLERDTVAGVATVATALGERWARRIGATLVLGAAAAAVASSVTLGSPHPWLAIQLVGGAVAVSGTALAWAPRRRARQLAWEVQAAGAAIAALGWVGGAAAAGLLAG